MSKLKFSLSNKMSQNLKVSPQLQQAIKMLQMNRMDLKAMIQQELMDNPILEEVSDHIESDVDEVETHDEGKSSTSEMTHEDMEDWDRYARAENYSERDLSSSSGSAEGSAVDYEKFVSKKATLLEHLEWQAKTYDCDKTLKAALLSLIHHIAPTGYLEISLEDLSKQGSFTKKQLQQALPVLQSFDPIGVGARSLKEALLIQARTLCEIDVYVENIIENHLDDLSKEKYQKISLAVGLDLQGVKDVGKTIANLNPLSWSCMGQR